MKRHLNLMTKRAGLQTCLRKRTRQWAIVLLSTSCLLVPIWLVSWWPVYQQGLEVAAIETKYEPIRQMNKATKDFQKRLELVRVQEQTALALAEIDTPVVTLLGLLGQAVAESQGSVYVESLEFGQDTRIRTEQTIRTPSVLAIDGRGIDPDAVEGLTSSLQSSLPFSKVTLEAPRQEEINRLQTWSFNIESSF